jgi:hypothetical protein
MDIVAVTAIYRYVPLNGFLEFLNVGEDVIGGNQVACIRALYIHHWHINERI